jgi:hypothetical protein
MCLFSRPVEHVSATRIFARRSAPGRQVLVYEMTLAVSQAVAMLLPIPVPPGSSDDAVQFLSLERYRQFFRCLENAFPRGATMSLQSSRSPPERQMLAVHTVGAFEASFVPSPADFERLDERFRLPAGVVDAVPAYGDWGFAVFQLATSEGDVRVHPMAFEFPTRHADALFFPTLHVHDGVVHRRAEFDHTLYSQGIEASYGRWSQPLRMHMLDCPPGLIDPDAPAHRTDVHGESDNSDRWASLRA